MRNFSLKDIALTGMGIALFIVLSLCLQVSVFENYYLCLGYIVMAVYLYSFGTIRGTIVGVIGTILYCLLISGLRGMPGWALGNIAIGIVAGYAFKLANVLEKKAGNMIAIIGVVLGTAIGILGLKSATEVLLYAQPFFVRVASNMPAFIADTIVLVTSVPICKLLHMHINRN